MDTRPIGVFDSGLGGLTAVKELEKILPNENIVYFGDTGRVPYGTKDRETLVRYALQDISFLNTFDVKFIVIACGTISSVAFAEASRFSKVPLSGVIMPTAKAAVEKSTGGRIGVLGTSMAISSGSYEKAIRQLKPDAKIKSRACPLFVPLVESGHFERRDKEAQRAAHEYLDSFAGEVDTLILGCTHYPLLRDIIEDILPDVAIVDSGRETAKASAGMLAEKGLLSRSGGKRRFYISGGTDSFARLAGIFLEHPVADMIEKIEIEKY